MKEKQFRKARIIISIYVSILVSVAITNQNNWLALTGIITGILFLWLMKKKMLAKTADERTEQIAGKAATITYSIVSTSLAAVSLFLIFVAKDQAYLFSIGIILSYVALIMIGLFAILYQYFLKK